MGDISKNVEFFIYRNATSQPYLVEKWKGCMKTRILLSESDLKSGGLILPIVKIYADSVFPVCDQ